MKALLSPLLVLSFFSSFSQTANTTERKNESNIYYQALKQYLISETTANIIHDSLYIEDDFKITDSLLSKSGNTQLVRLTFENVQQLLKTRDALTLYRIFPLQYEKDYFIVSFVPFRVTKDPSKDNYNYSNGGGCDAIFKFQNKKFIFLKVKCYGI
jgi:hypothetical protein